MYCVAVYGSFWQFQMCCCLVLQCVAVCCSGLQLVAMCCSSKCVAVCCCSVLMLRRKCRYRCANGLQTSRITATHCNTLQHTRYRCANGPQTSRITATHCNTLQHTATHQISMREWASDFEDRAVDVHTEAMRVSTRMALESLERKSRCVFLCVLGRGGEWSFVCA